MSAPETLNASGLGSYSIGTISASVPFHYSTTARHEHGLTEDLQLDQKLSIQSSSDVVTSSGQFTLCDIRLNKTDDLTEDVKFRDREMSYIRSKATHSCSKATHSCSKATHSCEEDADLRTTNQTNVSVPRLRSCLKRSRSLEHVAQSVNYPPQIHVRMYRKSTNNGRYQSTSSMLDALAKEDDQETASLNERNHRVNRHGFKSKLNSVLSSSIPSVFHKFVDENNLSSAESYSSSNESLDKIQQQKGTRLKNRFTKKRPNVLRVAFLKTRYGKEFPSPSASLNADVKSDTTTISKDEMHIAATDNTTLENGAVLSTDSSRNNKVVRLDQPNDVNPLTVTIQNNLPITNGCLYCTLATKFTTTLPADEMAKNSRVIKDATDIRPLSSGEAIVTDILSNKIVLFDSRGFPKITFAMEAGSEPWSTCVTPDDVMAVTMKGEGCVCIWSPKGEALQDFGQDLLSAPTGIYFDHRGRFVVADEGNNSVLLFSDMGKFLGELTHGTDNQNQQEVTSQDRLRFNKPRCVTVTRDGLFIVSDSGNQNVKVFDQDGRLVTVIGSYGREDGQLRFPYGVAFDEDSRLIYVADHYNHRISVFNLEGCFMHHVLTQSDAITRPKGLAIHDSKLYVTYGDLRAGNVSVYHLHSNSTPGYETNRVQN